VEKAGIFLSSELSSLTTLNLGKAIGNTKLFENLDMVELGFRSLLPALFALDLGGLGWWGGNDNGITFRRRAGYSLGILLRLKIVGLSIFFGKTRAKPVRLTVRKEKEGRGPLRKQSCVSATNLSFKSTDERPLK